jgi:ABC-2 type transport system ATP-binding protein
MTKDGEPAIDVVHLTKRYGDLLAVDDVSFTVRMGELFAFVGPNGAGKTTTVEIIDTIRPPTSGTVRLLGMDVTKRKRDILPRIGVLPQGFTSFDRITVTETIQYYARLFSRPKTDVEGLIDLVNLEDKSAELFQNLSGGLKQRLGIAVALVNDPEVVFLDEPTTGLDPRARREVWDVLVGLKKRGKTIVLTTHYMEEAELLCDEVAIMDHGRIVAQGPPQRLLREHFADVLLELPRQDFPAAARELPLKLLEASDRIEITTQDLEGTLRTLLAAHVPLSSLRIRPANLEDLFLALTGKELRP